MNELQHTSINRGVMLDWLCYCEEQGTSFPTDQEIVDRFSFHNVEQARTLLADLSDRGKITIRHTPEGRQIRIGKSAPIHTGSSRPGRTIKKPDTSVDKAVERIMAIVRGKPKAPAENVQAAPIPARQTPPASPPKPPAVPKPIVPPAPRPQPVRPARPEPARLNSKARQLNLHLSEEAFAAIRAIAAREGVANGRVAINIVEAALRGPTCEPAADETVALDRKPRVPVAVLHAANDAGADLHQFCSTLLDLGLECWMARREAAR